MKLNHKSLMARPEILRAVMLQIKLLSRMGHHVGW